MSELPPNIDAILASIRSRMTEEPGTAPPAAAEPPHVEAAAAPVPVATLGEVAIDTTPQTLSDLVRSLLEPLLKTWLDTHMPEIVERMAQDEIKRLTGRD